MTYKYKQTNMGQTDRSTPGKYCLQIVAVILHLIILYKAVAKNSILNLFLVIVDKTSHDGRE